MLYTTYEPGVAEGAGEAARAAQRTMSKVRRKLGFIEPKRG